MNIETHKITIHPLQRESNAVKYSETVVADLVFRLATVANDQGKKGYSLKSIYYGVHDFKDAKYVSLFFVKNPPPPEWKGSILFK